MLALIFVPFLVDVVLGLAPAAVADGLGASTLCGWMGGELLSSPTILVSALVWYVLPCAAGTVRCMSSDST